MDISNERIGNVDVVSIQGSLDTNTAAQAQGHINPLLEQGARIVVDFQGLDYISSAGLRVLLATAKRLKKTGGALRICNPNDMVTEVFEVSGFGSIFDVYADRSKALDGF